MSVLSLSLLAIAGPLAACGPEPQAARLAPPPPAVTAPGATDDPTLAVTADGPVRGAEVASGTRVWKGIPFAAPPIGDLRFRPPAPVAPWTEELDATRYRSSCTQIVGRRRVVGSEDCLYLNVWSPRRANADRLPVLFWIHGGDNITGSSSDPWYDGTELAERANAVVVTINYRLGAFGFLAHPAFERENPRRATGNYGLHDAIAALSWVQRNITTFGGDPTRVLVFGQSAGASNTCALVASPLARGLFSRAMMLSLSCHVISPAIVDSTNAVVERKLGCAGAPDIAACLRAAPASALANLPGASLEPSDEVADYYETIDGWAVPAHPELAFAKGTHNRMPMIMGTTKDEYESVIDLILRTAVDTEEQYESALAASYGERAGSRIAALYPFASFPDGRAAMVSVVSDSLMHCPTRRAARATSKGQREAVYRYLFAQVPSRGPGAAHGAAHGVDVDYVFRFAAPEVGVEPTPEDEAVSDALIASIGRFAAAGSPGGAGPIAWPRYDAASEPIAVIAATPPSLPAGDPARCDFWDAIGD